MKQRINMLILLSSFIFISVYSINITDDCGGKFCLNTMECYIENADGKGNPNCRGGPYHLKKFPGVYQYEPADGGDAYDSNGTPSSFTYWEDKKQKFSRGTMSYGDQRAFFNEFTATADRECKSFNDIEPPEGKTEISKNDINKAIDGCSMLANLVALRMYDENSKEYAIYKEKAESGDTYLPLPEITFNESYLEENNTIIDAEMGTDRDNTQTISRLPFIVFKYFLNGTLAGKFDMNNELLFAKKNASDGISYRLFGGAREIRSTINILNYFNSSETMFFYEVFYDNKMPGSVTSQLIPIPILVFNSQDESLEVKKDKYDSYKIDKKIYYDFDKRKSLKYFRRLFMFDNLSTLPDVNHLFYPDRSTGKILPKAVTYAKSIKLVIEKRDSNKVKENNKKINLPFIEVFYATRSYNDAEAKIEADVIFTSYYYSDLKNYWKLYYGFLIALLVLGILISLYRIYVWTLLNPKELFPSGYVVSLLIEFLLQICRWCGPFMFWFLWGVSAYWYLFYRYQYRAFIIMPPLDQLHYNRFYRIFDITFGVGCGVYFIHMVHKIYQQCSFCVFFIDWEHDKEIFNEYQRTDFGKFKKDKPKNELEQLIDEGGEKQEEQIGEKKEENPYGDQPPAEKLDLNHPMSETNKKEEGKIRLYNPRNYKYRGAWRMLHVANQFNFLQRSRQISLFMCFGFTILFYYYTSWLRAEYAFINHANDEMTWKYLRINPILRHCIVSFIVIVVGGIQFIVILLLQLWLPLKKTEFMDLCSISNISVFILDEKLHGYYIHGQAPSGKADVNLNELLYFLNREAEGKLKRGQQAQNSNTVASYEMYISVAMRTIYDGLFYLHEEILNSNNHKIEDIIATSKIGEIFAFFRQHHLDINLLATYMNNQLKAKMEAAMGDRINSTIETKTFVQKFLDFPPDNVRPLKTKKDIILYKDTLLQFDEVLFSGMEWQWFIMDVFFLQMWMRITKSIELSMLLTYLLDFILHWCRYNFGESNLAAKAVIDGRFLC